MSGYLETRASVRLTKPPQDRFRCFGPHQLWVGFEPSSTGSAGGPTNHCATRPDTCASGYVLRLARVLYLSNSEAKCSSLLRHTTDKCQQQIGTIYVINTH